MKLINVYFPETYLEALDGMVKEKRFPNRSEAIRIAVRDLMKTEHVWLDSLCSKDLEEKKIND